MKICFYTDLSVDECIERIKSNVDDWNVRFFSFDYFKSGEPSGNKEIIGKINGNKFKLYKRFGFKAPRRFFYGRLIKEKNGTKIKGYFSLPLFPKIFFGIWFLGVIIMGGYLFIMSLIDIFTGSNEIENLTLGMLVLPAFLLFGIILVNLTKWVGREVEIIIHFIEKTLEAKQITGKFINGD